MCIALTSRKNNEIKELWNFEKEPLSYISGPTEVPFRAHEMLLEREEEVIK